MRQSGNVIPGGGPDVGEELARNPRVIFFEGDLVSSESNALGLQARRSVAVDTDYLPRAGLGFIALDRPQAFGVGNRRARQYAPFRRFAINQDTGSAIISPARADIFTGSGSDAGSEAGSIKHAATFHILVPRPAATRLGL